MSGVKGGVRDAVPRWFGVLGTLQVVVGGRPRPVTAGKARVVLAGLLLNANQPVAMERLIDYVWDDPPVSARTVLHSLVLRLRRVFGNQDLIRTSGSGYLITVAAGELDLDMFCGLLDRASLAREREDMLAERAHLVAALDLWRGPALADVPSGVLQRGEAAALQERRLQAMTRRIDLDLMSGGHADVVSELRAITRDHPLQERSWGQLMTALYRCGRQAEALAIYQDVRRMLAQELGVEPGTDLRDVHQAILTADPGLDPPVATAVTAPRVEAWRQLCQLPRGTGDLAGRNTDHDRIAEQLTAAGGNNAVVIWGSPGVGKSTLAVHIAHRLRATYPDGQWHVMLQGTARPAADPAEVLAGLLAASGVPAGAIPPGLHMRAAAFRARLADRRVLVVLDDAAGVDQVRPLLPGTPSSAVLITSRSALGELPGAQHYKLGSLATADAVAMLSDIIGETRINQETTAAYEIAALCAGLPLALRILGSRLQTQPNLRLAAMADRLRDQQRRLDELNTGTLTIRAEIQSSYQGLDQPTQQAFRRMGLLHSADFAAPTLGALTNGTDGQQLVEALTNAGLLDPAAPGPTGHPRYRPHDLIALYARELAAQEDTTLIRQAIERSLNTLFSHSHRHTVHREATKLLQVQPPDHPATPITPRPRH